MAEHLRDRCFATARFCCTKIRYTGAVCGSPGSVEIKPSVLLPVGGEDTLAFLSCTCLPSWEINHVPIDKPLLLVVSHKDNDRFSGMREGRGISTGWLGGRPIATSIRHPRRSTLAGGTRPVFSRCKTSESQEAENGSCRIALALGYPHPHSLAHVGARLAALIEPTCFHSRMVSSI